MSKKEAQLDTYGFRKFGMIDKLAYAAGDFGCNMSFALKTYLTAFWTQVMGIENTTMAILLLLVQIWDAINDPVVGSMIDADRRTYKLGKFRTYIFIGSVGLMVSGAACFLPFQNAAPMIKNILFVVGYVLWDAFYTIANVPYGSMLSLISNNPIERAQLSTFRSVGSTAGNIVCMIVVPMVVYDASNNLNGGVMFILALVMGLLGFVSFQFMIHNTVERVQLDVTLGEEAPKFNIFKAVGNFLRNRPAVGATLAPFGMFLANGCSTLALQVVFQSYFQNAKVSGIISALAYMGVFIWIPFISKIVNKFGKKEAVTLGIVWNMVVYGAMCILPITPDTKGIMVLVVCQVLATIGSGIGSCVSWSLMADAMDYEEWKFGTRNEGTTYALHSFFRKLAQGIGPSLGLIVAGVLGYDGTLGPAQTMETAINMRYLLAASYLIGAVIQFVSYAFVYNLDKNTVAVMDAELTERREAGK